MIRTETIAAGRVHGHLAHAERPRGGVLLLPTIFGVDGFAQGRARMLAEAGFTTLVWDPYPGDATPADMAAATARAGKLTDGTVEDMTDCMRHMRDQLALPGVAVLGFCLGGRYALLLAARGGVAGCVAYYPSIRVPAKLNETEDAVARSAAIGCPVHLIQAGADEVIVHATYLRLRDTLEKRPAATVVQFHPGAVHSFMRDAVQHVPANAMATRLSWPPAIAFLEACLPRG
jgi:carboxymethylenebutenolidase